MANKIFDIGDAVRLFGSFSDIDFVPIDPSTVTFRIRDPAGIQTTYVYSASQVVKQDTGVYYVDYLVNTIGIHNWKFLGTGSGQVMTQDQFDVSSDKT